MSQHMYENPHAKILQNPKLSLLGSQELLCPALLDLKPHHQARLQQATPVTLESVNPHMSPPCPSSATSPQLSKATFYSNSENALPSFESLLLSSR